MMHQCDYCCWYNENTPSEDEEYEYEEVLEAGIIKALKLI